MVNALIGTIHYGFRVDQKQCVKFAELPTSLLTTFVLFLAMRVIDAVAHASLIGGRKLRCVLSLYVAYVPYSVAHSSRVIITCGAEGKIVNDDIYNGI